MVPPPVIVAFAGPPGAGKSVLIAALQARRPASAVLAADDFPAPHAMPPEALAAWLADGERFADLDISAFAEALRTIRAGRPVELAVGRRVAPAALVLAEAPLGRAHPDAAPLIDRLVWIDTPLDVALARNLVAWRGDARPPTEWIDGYVDTYLQVTRSVLVAQRAAVMPGADLVLDGVRTVEAMADEVTAWLGR